MSNFAIQTKAVPTFYFIGVTTGKSAINKVFPRWMEILGRPDVNLAGVDHPLRDDPQAYRATVAQIKYDPLSLGGLVTSHKINLLAAARDMFDALDESAMMTGEVSSLSKRDSRLWGHAKDPLTGGLSLDAILEPGYFGRTGGHLLCFGAGGSGKAISLHLIRKTNPTDRPEKVVIVNRSQPNLESLRIMVERLGTDIQFEYLQAQDPGESDAIMDGLPDGSVVINATGAGKDFPGSPVSDAGVFPRHGVVWEINYRGQLDFWRQAKRQQISRDLVVEDGWLYFLYGWTQVIAEVLHVEIDEATFKRLAQAAEEVHSPLIWTQK